jgi:hypothetical protein
MLLPNLARLDLRHREAATSADDLPNDLTANETLDDDGTPPGKQPKLAPAAPGRTMEVSFMGMGKRPRRAPPSIAPPPPPPREAIPIIPVIDEEDDEAIDEGLRKVLKDRAEIDELTTFVDQEVNSEFPLGKVNEVLEGNVNILFDTVLMYDEPPNRYFFSSTGPPAAIRFMRVSKDTLMEFVDPVQKLGDWRSDVRVGVRPFEVLKALRRQFGNQPKIKHREAPRCGASNCFFPGLPIDGMEGWQTSIRAIMLSLDANKWTEGLPKTVAVRAPMAAQYKGGIFAWNFTQNNRDELKFTLRAAQMGIAPPVYAAFPVKIVNQEHGTLSERSHAYVFEDGWTELVDMLYILLPGVHTTPKELQAAKASIAKGVHELIRAVSREANWLQFDIKSANMVTRRVSETTNYQVRMIDFGATYTAVANKYNGKTRPDCVFFVNGLLFLNTVDAVEQYDNAMHRDLAVDVINTWEQMSREDSGGLCNLLEGDTQRVPEETASRHKTSLDRVKEERYESMLRFAFYSMLGLYGVRGNLLTPVDRMTMSTPKFIDRLVNRIRTRFVEP